MDNDKNIDAAERDIEQDCLKILLMEHPVASDFRDISAALKMITDLERIADQASDIAEISLHFPDESFIKEPEHIELMSKYAVSMVKDGVQSYINRDVEAASELDKRDDNIDKLFETVKNDLIALIRQNPDAADQAILFMMIAKYLEESATMPSISANGRNTPQRENDFRRYYERKKTRRVLRGRRRIHTRSLFILVGRKFRRALFSERK